MSAIVPIKQAGTALATAEQAEAVRTALKSSLYPGASDASVDLVLAYCRASNLDPMTKPVHIVPMKVSTGRKDEKGWDVKETRDVVMPGIGLYRINAARTGEYAGCSEPEYGPTRVLEFHRDQWADGANGRRVKTSVPAQLHYPEWCRVTVTRIVDGKERQFTAKEYWIENFAEKGEGGGPNSMWEKRPFAQLAKCTEAQALRKAFPEAVGSQPTADEMEGKDVIEGSATVVQGNKALPSPPPELPVYTAEEFEKNLPTWQQLVADGKKTVEELISFLQTKRRFTEEQLLSLRKPKPNPAFPLPGDDEGPDANEEGAK